MSEPIVQDCSLIHTHIFDAPRRVLWNAWANEEHITAWWGPNGFTSTCEKFEFRQEGVWSFILHSPDGADYPNKNVFAEIISEEKIILDHSIGHDFRIIATFEDLGNKSKLTWEMIFPTKEECEQFKPFVIPANEQNIDRLEAYLNQIK